MTTRRTTRLLAAGVLVLALTAAACSDRDDGSAATGDRDTTAPTVAGSDEGGAEGGGGSTSGDGGDTGAVPVDLSTAQRPDGARHVISTGELTMRATEPVVAVERATDRVLAAGGFLFAESAADDDDRASVQAVYKVPPERFAELLDAIAELGDDARRSIRTEDVTGRVVDLEARLASTQASVARLRELLGSSGSVADLLGVEQSLAQREAVAESLAAQLGALRDQVAMATITLTVTEADPVATSDGGDVPGFSTALGRGARAFGTVAAVAAAGAGLALPFLGFAAIVGIAWWLLARLVARRHRAAPAA